MRIPKPSTLHFLALSLALNIVLLGLVVHFVTTSEPAAPVAAESRPARPVAAIDSPRPAPPEVAPIAPAPAPLPAAPVYAPAYAAAAPVAQVTQNNWTPPAPSPVASSGYSAPSSTTTPSSNTYSPETPGNSFRFRDMTVAIEGESPAEGGGTSGLLLSLSGSGVAPVSSGTLASSPSGGGTTQPASTNVASNNSNNQNSGSQAAATPSNNTTPDSADPAATPSRSRSGFTYEEQLFRAKWGWQAFNDAQMAAARAAAAAATPAN